MPLTQLHKITQGPVTESFYQELFLHPTPNPEAAACRSISQDVSAATTSSPSPAQDVVSGLTSQSDSTGTVYNPTLSAGVLPDGCTNPGASIKKTLVKLVSFVPYVVDVHIWLNPSADLEAYLNDGWTTPSITGYGLPPPSANPIPLENSFSPLSAPDECDEEPMDLTVSPPPRNPYSFLSSITYSWTRNPRRKRFGRKPFSLLKRLRIPGPDFEFNDSFRQPITPPNSPVDSKYEPTPDPMTAVRASILRRVLNEKRREDAISHSRFTPEMKQLASFTTNFTSKMEEVQPADLTGDIPESISASLEAPMLTIIQTKLQAIHKRPIECATCLAGFIAWIGMTIKMGIHLDCKNNRGLAAFELASHITIGIALISELYHLLKDTEFAVTLPKLQEFITACREKFNSIFDIEESMTKSQGVKIGAGVGYVLCKLFGLPVRELTDFSGFLRGASELEDTFDSILWHFCEIDLTGKHLLSKTADTLVVEASKIIEMPTEKFHGKCLQDASQWLERANLICKQIDKSKYPTLTHALVTIQTKVAQAKQAQYGTNILRPAPVVVLLHGHPGSGKSHYINTYLVPYLSKISGAEDTRIYNLNTGKHSARYEGQIWGFYDELSASRKDNESHVLANLNNICSGYHAAIPGAGVDEKHQSASFKGVFFASNLDPNSIDLGLNAEAKKAFLSRVIKCEVKLEDYNPALPREGQVRRPDFSNVSFKISAAPGQNITFNGEQFARYVSDNLRQKQESFTISRTTAVPKNLKQEFDLVASINTQDDVTEANASPRTLWVFGPPGNGKTTRIIPMVKEYGDIVSQPVVVVKNYAEIVSPSEPTLIVIDDIVEVNTEAGQVAFNKFYDTVIQPSGSTLIVISNYGPYPYLTDSLWAPYNYFKSVFIDRSAKKVFNHAFGRRSGFVPSESTSVLELQGTMQCRDFFTHEVHDIRNLIYARLSGVGGMDPLTIDHSPITEVPFTEADADLWLDITGQMTSAQLTTSVLSGCSLRVVKVAKTLVYMDSPDIAVFTATFRETLKVIPDIKIRIKRDNCLIVADGPRIMIDNGAVLPRLATPETHPYLHDGEVELVGTLINIRITKEQFLNFISKKVSARNRVDVRRIAELTRISSLDKNFIYKMGEELGVTAWEYHCATRKRSSMILGGVTAGVASIGILGIIIWALKKYYFTETKTDELERKKNSIKNVTRYKSKGDTKWRKCSETDDDELPAYLEKDFHNFQHHIHTNDLGEVTEKQGKKFAKMQFQSGSRKVWANYNISDGAVEFANSDEFQAAHLPGVATFKSSATTAMVEALKQNIVAMNDNEGIGWSYGTMLSDTIGVTVLHVWEKNINNITFEHQGKTVKKSIVKIAEYPEYEQAYFRITDPTPGPFKSLHKYVPSMDQLSNANMATMICSSHNNVHLFTNVFSVEATISTKFDNESIKAWKTNIGYIYYGASSSPTTRGSCGLPVFVELSGVPYLAGIHAVNRKTSARIGSTLITTEVWETVQRKIRQFEPKLNKSENDDVIQMRVDKSLGYAIDNTFKSKHPLADPPYIPIEILSHVTPVTDEDFQPHGPGVYAIGHYAKGTPADTKGTKYEIGACVKEEPPFPNNKIPTISEDQIIKNFPEKIPVDKRGVRVAGYARLQAANNNVFRKKGLMSKTEAAAFGKEMFAEHGVNSKRAEALSIQEAVAGCIGSQPIKRTASNGSVLDGIFHSQGKGTLVDYDDFSREVIYPKGDLIKKWIVDQWEYAKEQKRIHIPCTLGLKSETLAPEKIWKKRVFAVVNTVTWINQKRILQPLQQKLCAAGTKSRYSLIMDPILEADNFVQDFAGEGGKFAGFDWSSFDMTVPGSVVELTAIALAQGYANPGEEPPKKLLNILVTLMKDMTFSSATYDKTIELFEGGIRSGMANTSLTDSITVIVIIYLEFSRNVFPNMKPFEFFRDVRTRHGGDDLAIAVAMNLAVKIDLGAVCARISETYGMKLTIDTKTDEVPDWVNFTDISFLSRTFFPHPQHPQVWISKLKEASVSSSLYYSESKDPMVHLDTLAGAAREVFAHGEAKYEQYRDYAYAIARFHNMPINIPSYSAMSHDLWTQIVTNEPRAVQERIQQSSPLRNKLAPLSLEMSESRTRSLDSIKSSFVKTLRDSTSFREFQRTLEYTQFLEVTKSKQATLQSLRLGENKVMIFPRNSHAFWHFAQMRMKNTPGTSPSNYHELGMSVLDSWRTMFRKEKMDDIWTPPGNACGTKKIQNYRLHLIPYLFIYRGDFSDKIWNYIKMWALDTFMFEGFAMYDSMDHFAEIMETMPQCLTIYHDEVQSSTDGGVAPVASDAAIASSSSDGGAQQPFAADANAALVQTAEMPPAVAGGTGSVASAILESLGGYTVETFPRGGFVNSVLAPCYQECPLSTINVGVSTAENTVLWQTDIDPWDPTFTGPFIHQWAMMHQRFAGSFELGLKVSSAGTILGRIALYYVPGDMELPAVPTRQNMMPFQHVIIDLQQPSAQSLVVRNSNRTDFYVERNNTDNRGQLLILCYTTIANTYGADIMPPVYPTIRLGADAMFALPTISVKPPPREQKTTQIPPIPTIGNGFMFTDGKNYAVSPINSYGLPIQRQGNAYGADHCLTGGVIRTSSFPPQSTEENKLGFRWGAWRSPNNPTYADQANTFGSGTEAEGECRHFTVGYDPADPIDTIVTMSTPWNYRLTRPAPNAQQGILNAYSVYSDLMSFPLDVTAEYVVSSVTPNNGDSPLMWIEPDGVNVTDRVPIQPVFNSSLGTFVHEKVTAAAGAFLADRFKVVVDDVSFTAGDNSNAAPNAITHNMVYKNFTAERSCVCKTSFPSTGGDIPPGYMLVMWYEDDAEVFPFGVSGVLPGIKGPTHAPTANWFALHNSAIQFLEANSLKSYIIKGTTANGQTSVFLLFNKKGIWTYNTEEYGLAVSNTASFNWFFEAQDERIEWPILRESSPEIFQSRLDGAPSNDQAQMMAGIAGGLLSGMGNGLSNFQNHKWDLEKQKNDLTAQREMQENALANARDIAGMNNQAAQGIAVQNGINAVNAVNARIAGSNPIRLAASQTGESDV